ncbi:MAG: glycosyltransferase [Patescibacteria group bacterium]
MLIKSISKNYRIAIITDFLTQLGGAERVILALTKIFPDAPIYTLFYNQEKIGSFFTGQKIKPLFTNQLFCKFYKQLLVLYPFLFKQLKLKEYDIIISVTSALAKGIKKEKGQIHICYCNTPTRFLWIDKYDYIATAVPMGLQWLMRIIVPWLQKVDFHSAQTVDYFIANSQEVAKRIKKYYHRESAIIYPPVDTEFFSLQTKKQDYYLMSGRVAPYKRFDIAVKAFSNMPEKKLIIAGAGPELEKLKQIAGENIQFLGRVYDEKLKKLYQNARAYIFTPLEDFGITPVEAMSCGTPVIAYGEGGALETVQANESGIFFTQQTPESLAKAISDFEQKKFNPKAVRDVALRFCQERFKIKIEEFVKKVNK